jgi:CRP-like cAMP-binding protein
MIETELALWKPPSSEGAEKDELATLRQVPLFNELGDPDLRRVTKLLHVRQYAANEVVFREGQTGAGMYIIQRGEVEICLQKADGTEIRLVTLRAGQFFGELALLESTARSASSVARQPSVLLGLFQSDLEHLVARDSRLGAKVLWNLARMTGARLRELSDSVRSRPSAPAGNAEST